VVSWPESALHLALYPPTDRRPARQRLAQGVSPGAVPGPNTAQIFGKATARCEGDKNEVLQPESQFDWIIVQMGRVHWECYPTG